MFNKVIRKNFNTMINTFHKSSAGIAKFISLSFGLLCSSPLFAEVAAPAAKAPNAADPSSGMMTQILMLAVFGFIFYFLIWRPQSKRAKQQKDLISSLQKGDEVITAGGILGKIQRIKDDFMVILISEGTEVVIQRQAIAGSLPKGTIKDI